MKEHYISPDDLQVTQANELMLGAYSMSLLEKRLVLLYVSMIRKDDTHMRCVEMPAKDVMNFLGLGNNKDGYGRLREYTRDLLTRIVDIDTSKNGSYKQFQWMSYVEYIADEDSDTGQATLKLQGHSMMKPFFLELKERFATIPFSQIAALPSFHTVRLFEILWAASHQLQRPTVRFKLDALKTLLGLKGKKFERYENFNDFRRYVLDKAKRDFDKKTPISFTYTTEKTGRKVTALVFVLAPNQRVQQLGLNLPHKLLYKELPPQPELPNNQQQRDLARERLEKLGISKTQVERLSALHTPDYINENLDVVEKRQNAGGIKNLKAYILKALAQDYRTNEPEPAPQAPADDDESRYDAERRAVVASLTKEVGEETLFEEFQPELETIIATNAVMSPHYKNRSWSVDDVLGDKLLRSYYHQFVLNNFAAPYLRTFEAWQEKQR